MSKKIKATIRGFVMELKKYFQSEGIFENYKDSISLEEVINILYKNGLINSENPNKYISREKAVYLIIKILKLDKIFTNPLEISDELKNTKGISMKYYNAMKLAARLGILNTSHLDPKSALTVEELSELFKNTAIIYWNNIKRNVYVIKEKLTDNKQKITISLGEVPTGGYSVKIKNYEKNGNKLIIYYKINSPSLYQCVTQVFTNPFDSVIIDNLDEPVEIELKRII